MGYALQHIPVPVPVQDKLGGLWQEWVSSVKLGGDGALKTQIVGIQLGLQYRSFH